MDDVSTLLTLIAGSYSRAITVSSCTIDIIIIID